MKHAHLARPWRIHQLAKDFELADVWRFDLGSDDGRDFDAFLENLWAVIGTLEHSTLGRARVWIGDKLGWDAAPSQPIPGCTEHSIADRLTASDRAANRFAPSEPSPLPAAGAKPIYRFADEALYEISNQTIHALLHVSWPPGSRSAVLAVYVKYRGVPSRIYMAAIWPARRFIIYPALISRVEKRWSA